MKNGRQKKIIEIKMKQKPKLLKNYKVKFKNIEEKDCKIKIMKINII